MECLTERLSSLENLYFPRAVQSNATTPSQRKSILMDLLDRDAALFLERYGSQLTSDELGEFDALNNDYEINWHLKNLRSKMNPTSEELQSRSVTVKNRRLAYLNKLIHDGQYFSEDAMREREPYSHHEYVGKFQDMSGRIMARPGERWSETLMRRSEEAVLVAKIREEQQRLGVPERDWIGNERNQEEEEEEEEEMEEATKSAAGVVRSTEIGVMSQFITTTENQWGQRLDNGRGYHLFCATKIQVKASSGVGIIKLALFFLHAERSIQPKNILIKEDANNGVQSTMMEHNQGPSVSAEETEDMMEQFTYIMQHKFLSGEDHQHFDYSRIDNDETLDDHWLREASEDAEEKYFAED